MQTLGRPRSRQNRPPRRQSPLKALLLSAGMGFAALAGVGIVGDRISAANDAVKGSTPAPSRTAHPGPGGWGDRPLQALSRAAADRPVVSPSPGPGETRALLAGLREIDPALDHRRSISRARESCRDLVDGMGRREVADRTRRRFGGTAGVGLRQAGLILAVIEDTFCPS
ncbi:hypothetical protein [Streptosporangium roseum]|uniref:hypothetical protein n=1 Tax=Streptosporangium roseum TaxID=2001 RepID=UPI0033184399